RHGTAVHAERHDRQGGAAARGPRARRPRRGRPLGRVRRDGVARALPQPRVPGRGADPGRRGVPRAARGHARRPAVPAGLPRPRSARRSGRGRRPLTWPAARAAGARPTTGGTIVSTPTNTESQEALGRDRVVGAVVEALSSVLGRPLPDVTDATRLFDDLDL